MLNKTIAKYSVWNSLSVATYVALVASFMTNAGSLFGDDKTLGVLGPIIFLLLFVISAAVMGLIVFGRPVVWYLDGKKREAIYLAVGTVACLILIAMAFLIIALIISSSSAT